MDFILRIDETILLSHLETARPYVVRVSFRDGIRHSIHMLRNGLAEFGVHAKSNHVVRLL